MELKEIKELIKLVSETGVSEVEIERGDFKLAIKKIEEKVLTKSSGEFIVIVVNKYTIIK
jgi:acetyl-CoA carboxylase biotin carboxyl carrier protein